MLQCGLISRSVTPPFHLNLPFLTISNNSSLICLVTFSPSAGNEDDYIIISLVRSKDLGFLKDLRRTNVMLTRCKRGMYICANRKFLEGKGKECLVGKMAAEWGEEAWMNMKDVMDGKVETEA